MHGFARVAHASPRSFDSSRGSWASEAPGSRPAVTAAAPSCQPARRVAAALRQRCVVARGCRVHRQVRYLRIRRESQGQLPCGDARAVSHLSVVQDLRDIAGNRSFKHVYICSCCLSPVAIPQSAGSAASVLEWHSTPPHRRHRLLVRQPHQPLFGTSFRKYVSQSVGDLESEARTRPAPGYFRK